MKYILLFLILFSTLYPQSMIVTGVDTDNYPYVNLDFLVLDDNGEAKPVDNNVMSLTEDGIEKLIQSIECNENYTKEPISMSLVIDVSASMKDTITLPSKRRIDVIRESAMKLIDILHPDSEITLVTFSTDVTIIEPLTTNRNIIMDAINSIGEPFGSTYISEAFLDDENGIIKSIEGAKHKKVVLFMTDGQDNDLEKDEILTKLNANSITLYTLGADAYLEVELVDITEATGGKSLTNITSEADINNAFLALAIFASGIETCRLSYISDKCSNNRSITLTYDELYSHTKQLVLSKKNLTEYNIVNNNQKTSNSSTSNNLYYVSIISNSDNLTINNIASAYGEFSLISPAASDFPIQLSKTEVLNLVFEPIDLVNNKNDYFKIESNSCENGSVFLKFRHNSDFIKVSEPNGGEEFLTNSNETLLWEDSGYESSYNVDYSTNKGANWINIATNYNDKDFPWKKIPGPETDNALLKVSKNVIIDSLVKTIGLETVNTNKESQFLDIIPYQEDKFIAVIDIVKELQFSNLDLFYTDFGLSLRDSSVNIKLILILNNKLEMIKYKPIKTSSANTYLTSIDNSPYVLISDFSHLSFDTLSYSFSTDSRIKRGIIIKLDADLDLVTHKLFEVNNEYFNQTNFIIDFENSKNSLHLLGTFKKSYEYDEEMIVAPSFINDKYFLSHLNKDLELINSIIFNNESDNFDFEPKGIEPINDDSVVWWGTGSGEFFNLDSNYRGITATSSYNKSNLVLNNYLEIDRTFDFNFIDYKHYKGFEYWLYFALDTIKIQNDELILPHPIFSNSLICFNDQNTIEWSVDLDKFGSLKKLMVFDNEEIVIGGLTNSTFKVDKYTIFKNGNTQFLSSFDLLTGSFNWLKHVPETTYKGLITSNSNNIIISGDLYRKTDFGNGFEIDTDSNAYNKNQHYLWSININNNSRFDISDSLWSIKSPGFEYVDTVDFGNVYSGSIKDTIVLDFFKVTDNSKNITIESVIIEDAGYSVDFSTPHALIENTDLKIILDVNLSGGGLAKGIISTDIGKFNFYVLHNEVELRYRPYYENDSLAINFGEVLVGEQKSKTINIIENLGLANIGIDSVKIINDNGNNYTLNIITDENLILSGDTLITEFVFSPNFVGTHNATAQFYTDIYREPFYIRITGKGISNDTVNINIKIDSIMYDAGKYIDLNTFINLNDNPASLQLDSLAVDIEYNATLLIPFRFPEEGSVENKIRKITLPISQAEIQKGIDSKRFYTTIGNSISTDIEIADVRAYNTNGDLIKELKHSTENGYFELTNVCYTDGSYRLYNESDPTDLNIYYENGEYFVNYNLIEDGFTNISIFGTDGKLVNHLVYKNMNKGAYTAEVDTKNIANGSYIVQLETENVVLSKIFVIVK